MTLSNLTAVSPIDGRYGRHTKDLIPYFSEFGLIKYRVQVEVEYFIALCELPLPQLKDFDKSLYTSLREIYSSFSEEDAAAIKEIEKTTNHDVKAVEYFIKKKFDLLNLQDVKEFIHFGLTSQDINNTAVPMMLRDAMNHAYLPELNQVIDQLSVYAKDWGNIPMLAKTHGQPASPTRLGKEIEVFVVRIKNQLQLLNELAYSGKFGGATGNFNAHHLAYPQTDWNTFGNEFLNKSLGIDRNVPTTQIDHYDNLSAVFDAIKRINTVLLDLSKDIWQYVSMNYFKQKIKAGEIGSSAMPHKVNPIDFENAEGNLGIANAILEHLSAKLPISRLQRDLTDSTVIRNIGVPLAHTIIALKSIQKGLGKLELNTVAIDADLNDNWPVVAEAIQTILRREAYPNPYEALKELTRTNDKIDETAIKNFIETLEVKEDIKVELRKISPFSYTGI